MGEKPLTFTPNLQNDTPIQYQRPTVISGFSVGVLQDVTPNIKSGSKRPRQTDSDTTNNDQSADEPAAKSRRVDNQSGTPMPTEQKISKRTVLKDKSTHMKVYCSSKDRTYKLKDMDLNRGYAKCIKKVDEDEKISILLEAIQRYDRTLTEKSDFVCYRGLLTKLAGTLYEGRFDNGISIAVQRKDNTIYMCEFPTEEASKNQAKETEKQKRMQYWGHKFESYVTADIQTSKQCCDDTINLNDEYCLLVQSKLGAHTFCFVGEVDCCFKEDRRKYVELKTSRFIDNNNPRQMRSLCVNKFYKWWLQSYLIGVEDILCGFRDDNGFVTELTWYKVTELPKLARQYGMDDAWNPMVCLNTLNGVLTFIKTNLADDSLYLLERKPKSRSFRLRKDESKKHDFLPDWFLSS